MTDSQHLTKPQIDLRIVIACAVAIMFTIPPLLVLLIPAPDPKSFLAGVKEGFYNASLCRSLISAALMAVLYTFRPSRLTFLATVLLLAIATIQCGFYARTFPTIMHAVKNLLPEMARSLFLSFPSWLEYVFVYRAVVKGPPT